MNDKNIKLGSLTEISPSTASSPHLAQLQAQIRDMQMKIDILVDCFDGLLPCWTISTTPYSVIVNTMLDHTIAHLP